MHSHSSAHLEQLIRVSRGLIENGGAIQELQYLKQIAGDKSTYAATYLIYFFCIWFLSVLFIVMDGSVAVFNTSHSESYIAASSAAFVTIPMFLGVSLVGFYLGAEYISAKLSSANAPIADLSVEFASGALTFQMMLSNVIFVIMKKNWVFRLFYTAVETCWKP
jgi:hypothetical protein